MVSGLSALQPERLRDPEMKLHIFNDTINNRQRWCFINVSRNEALQLIESLATQLRRNDPNTGRLESTCRGSAEWMTIAVNDRLESED